VRGGYIDKFFNLLISSLDYGLIYRQSH
jgi:hypothetical protein